MSLSTSIGAFVYAHVAIGIEEEAQHERRMFRGIRD